MRNLNCIVGAGGFAKEVAWLTHDVFNGSGVDYRPHYFIDSNDSASLGTEIDGIPIISESEFLSFTTSEQVRCFVAIGDPFVRRKVVQRISAKTDVEFPVLIHPSVCMDRRPGKVLIGRGGIVCANAVMTTDIQLGSFVHVDVGSSVGHGAVLGDFVRLSPGVRISGNVTVGCASFVGAGAVILEEREICEEVIVGAGAVVISSITDKGTYVGVPAKKVTHR